MAIERNEKITSLSTYMYVQTLRFYLFTAVESCSHGNSGKRYLKSNPAATNLYKIYPRMTNSNQNMDLPEDQQTKSHV